MASTVLRVKRRLEDNPQDALVLMCKRIKTDKEELSPSLFVFRGTVDNQDTLNVKNIIPKQTPLKSTPKVEDIVNKMRKERSIISSENRYEIVNCHRGLKDETDTNDLYNLVDLKAKAVEDDVNSKYTYDIYTDLKQDFEISMIDNLVSIWNSDLIFDSNGDGRDTPSDHADDDDDSNDENNWRNDYPDSEASSIDEEDMIKAMKKCDIEDDLSSDAGEEKIYDGPSDVFNEDVKRYGEAYAKYKAKVLIDNPDLSSNNLILSNPKDDKGYRDDSDDGFYYGQDEDDEQFREQYDFESSDSAD